MRLLAIDEQNMAEIKRVRDFAEQSENVYDLVTTEKALKVPGDDQRHVAQLNDFRCVFSITKAKDGTYRHLSISVPSKDYPNPFVAYTIAQLFGFTGWDGRVVAPPPQDWLLSLNEDEHCVVLAQEKT